jgi:trimeric autotransporter adhesin
MRASITGLMTAACLLAAPVSNSAAPGAPQVTVGADIKQLIFDWDSVAGASYYRLMVKIGSSAYQPVVDKIPASTTQVKLAIAAHLQRWSVTRYAVAACNASGCTRSAAVFPQDLMLDAIGYFKASNTDIGDFFGWAVVLSDDGRTLAVTAPAEASNATGVNGNQADDSTLNSGAVYVFRRGSHGWQQEAYLKAGVNQQEQFFGSGFDIGNRALAINGSGTMVAVGAPAQDVGDAIDAGTVYIYERATNGRWSLTRTLQSPAPPGAHAFGVSIDMSADGRTLKVNSSQSIGDGRGTLITHIFVRPGSTWQHSATLPPIFADDACGPARLSGDGNTLVSKCDNFNTITARIVTQKRMGNSWSVAAEMPIDSFFMFTGLALDFDGNTLALQELGTPRTVGIYRWTGASWSRETGFTAPPIPDANGSASFGASLALNRTGNLLAIGDSFAYENGAGVSSTSTPAGEFRGAVYLWLRDDRTRAWSRRSVVKSPNPGDTDVFGASIALCGTGKTLAVGAYAEDSSARGIDGNRADNNGSQSGAAYLY